VGAELDAWFETASDCLAKASEEHRNPLAVEDNWFSSASEEASQRTEASSELADANDEFENCFSAYGYGDVGEAHGELAQEVNAVISEMNADNIGTDEARSRLADIADIETQMSADFETCDAPRREVERRVYTSEFASISERDGDKAALWSTEFKEDTERYLLEVDD
jgi:hypothetical protein